MSDFDGQMERELHRILDPVVGDPVPARRSEVSSHLMKKAVGGAGMALAAKVVTGFAMAALAAGAATEVAITRSFNPTDWGQQVRSQVEGCSQGINSCVTGFASQPATVGADQHRAAEAAQQGAGSTPGTGKNANVVGPPVTGSSPVVEAQPSPKPGQTPAPAQNTSSGPKASPPRCGPEYPGVDSNNSC